MKNVCAERENLQAANKFFPQKRKASAVSASAVCADSCSALPFERKKSGRTCLSAKIIGKSRNGKGVFCLILHQILS